MFSVFMNCVLVLLVFEFGYGFEVSVDENGPGKSLFLTPYIERGKIAEARRKASVHPFAEGVESYAGYLTVNWHHNSNLFFWFFKADDADWNNLPVTVWLQGGPGGSSLLALFLENGPYRLKGSQLLRRHHSWHSKSNMIYIDNPVGSGFSFTDDDEGYARNQSVIGIELHTALKQFFILFPSLYKNEFFISGESYAGKYIPALAHTIHEKNALEMVGRPPMHINDKVFINLKGLLIGNGLVDPPNMMKYGDYLYQLGLIDKRTMNQFHIYERQIRWAAKKKRWEEATEIFGKMVLQYIYYPAGALFNNVTGFHEHYNYVNLNPPDWTEKHTRFVSSDHFRRAIHVGGKQFNDGVIAAQMLKKDIVKSVIKEVQQLLNHYRIIFFNGQLDIICAYPLTVNFIRRMKWSSSYEYAHAKRHVWRVNGDVAGYYKTAGNLTEVLVRAAGHMVPSDQPAWAHVLFNQFISNKNLNDEL